MDLVETIPYPQIFFEKSAGIRNVIDQMFARTGASPKIAYETEEDQVIAGLVAQGFGIAVVPYMDILQKLMNIPVRQHRKSGRRETVCPGLRKPLMRVYSRNVLSKP